MHCILTTISLFGIPLTGVGLISIAIELAIVAYVIAKQRRAAQETEELIDDFRQFMPDSAALSLSVVDIPLTDIQQKQPHEILENLDTYRTASDDSRRAAETFRAVLAEPAVFDVKFYMPQPDADGHFADADSSNNIKSSSYYLFYQTGNKATFRVVTNNFATKQFLEFPHLWQYACEAAKPIDMPVGQVLSMTYGKAELWEEIWIVTQKSKLAHELSTDNIKNITNWRKTAKTEIPLILLNQTGPPFAPTLTAINTYLLRNKGGVADFSLVKDIVERNTSALDNDINITLPAPLYWGLVGTMGGIVVGLLIFAFNMSLGESNADPLSTDASNTAFSGGGIFELLLGICIGMAASAYGLYLTIRNSVERYKGAKSVVEARKNDFYTFIQTHLLPVLSQNVATGFQALQLNIQKFNADFSQNIEIFNKQVATNVSDLRSVVDRNFEALKSQEATLKMLKDLDLNRFTRANVDILQQLQSSMGQLEQFNNYLHLLNKFVEKSDALSDKVGLLFDRSDDFGAIAAQISEQLESNTQLTDFLTRHFADLETHQSKLNGAINSYADDANRNITNSEGILAESLKAVEKNTIDKISNFSEFIIKQEEVFKEAVQSKHNSLSHLEHLKTMNDNIAALKNQTERSQAELTAAIRGLTQQMATRQQSIRSVKPKRASFMSRVTGVFRRRKDQDTEGSENE